MLEFQNAKIIAPTKAQSHCRERRDLFEFQNYCDHKNKFVAEKSKRLTLNILKYLSSQLIICWVDAKIISEILIGTIYLPPMGTSERHLFFALHFLQSHLANLHLSNLYESVLSAYFIRFFTNSTGIKKWQRKIFISWHKT